MYKIMTKYSLFVRSRAIVLCLLIFAVASSCDSNGGNNLDPDPPPSNTVSTSFESIDTNFLPGEIQRILVEGTTLNNDVIVAQIADTLEFDLYRDTTVQSEALFFMVPEITPGSQTLTFMMEEQEQTLDFAIEEFEIIEDPTAYANSVVDSVETGLQALLDQTEETEAKELIEEALNELQQEKQSISSSSEEEIKLLARFLKTHLEPRNSSEQNKFLFTNSSSSDVCSDLSDTLLDNISLASLSVFAISSGNTVLSIPGLGTAIGSIAIAAGFGGFYLSVKNVKESITGYYNECLSLTDGKNSILKEITNSNNSVLTSRFSNKAAVDFEFQHNVSRAFTVESIFEVPQEIQSPLQELRDGLDFILNKLPDSWVEVLFRDFTKTDQDDPAQFSIQNITDDRIEGTAAAEQDQLSVTFFYKEGQMPENTQEFAFALVDKERADQRTEIEAGLEPASLPVAFDDSISVQKDGSRTDTLRAEMAESFEIVGFPASGMLTLDDPGQGIYTYTPDAGFKGEDQFTFRAINGEGESNLATVHVKIEFRIPDNCTLSTITTRGITRLQCEGGYQERFQENLNFFIVESYNLEQDEVEWEISFEEDLDYITHQKLSYFGLEEIIRKKTFDAYYNFRDNNTIVYIRKFEFYDNGNQKLVDRFTCVDFEQASENNRRVIEQYDESGDLISKTREENIPPSECPTLEDIENQTPINVKVPDDIFLYQLRNNR